MADKDYSVKINVGLNTSDAEKQLESFEKKVTNFSKELKGVLSGGGDLKFAVGGYSTSETMSTGYAEALKKSIKKNMAVNKDWEDSFDTLDDAVESSFEGIIETLQSAEMEMKREMNNLAQRYAKMLGVEFVSNIAESLGEQDFALPTPKMSERERKQATQDFMTAGDKIIYSPAAFMSALENLAQKIPFAEFPAQRIPVQGAGVDKISFRSAASYGKEMNLGGAFQPIIPEISDDIKENIFDLMDRATEGGNAEAVGAYIQKKAQEVLDRIFEIGYNAREGTFRSAGVTEGEESADNLIRYADASARQAIAKAEEEFGLAIGTLARHIQTAGTQYFDFDAATTVGDGNRVPSDPNILRQVVRGDYNDPSTGALMSMGATQVPDLMEQIFNNPAIIASGKEGIQGLMQDLGKFIKPDAPSDFDAEAFRRGLAQQKAEVEATGRELVLAFDTEFNDKLPQVFTEASITLRDSVGKLKEVFGFIQAPPSSERGAMTARANYLNSLRSDQDPIVAKNVEELQERAELLNKHAKAFGLKSIIPLADIGAEDFETNFKQFYAKMEKLTGVLKIAAELEIPVVGSNIQGAEFSGLDKSLKYINDKIEELGLQLPKLEAPVNQLLLDTIKVVNDAEKAKSPTAIALKSESMPGLKGAGVENLLRNLVTQFPQALGANLERIELKPGGGFKIDGLDAHFARADNEAVLIITEAMSKFEDLVGFMQTKIATDYQPKKVADKQMANAAQAAGGSGGGGLDARRVSGEEAENARKRFLTEKELLPLLKDLTNLEKQQVLVGLDRLSNTKEYKKLLDAERIARERIAEAEARFAASSPARDEGQLKPEAHRAAFAAILQEKSALEDLLAAGKKLEIQKRDEIKLAIRGKDVKDKDLQTTAKQIDEMNRLRSTTGGVGKEIVGQLKEQAAATKAVEQQTKSLINTWVTGRYALYDVGNAYSNVSRQLWMASRQIFNVTQAYRSYETAFTSVERSIQPLAASLAGAEEESRSLKNAFIELSEQIPVSFEDIARIATLGAQMGVAASGIVDFTKTVSQFSSITGVAADTVAQKFGRIAELANVDYSEFNNLGSAILFAGINAVATEPEIMTLSESIAAVSQQAGMLPQEIIGMATALASTGIQAEQARGVFTRVFADIDRVVSRGGEELNGFASVAGMSASEFQRAWGTEGASYEVFRAILGGLSATTDLTAAFDKLNIVETREINTLTRLANNLNVVDQAIRDANESFESGTFLGDAFEKTVDNLDSQIQMFNNNLKALGEQLSGTMAGALTVVIGVANEFLQLLKEIAKNPITGWLLPAAAGITALGAAATLAIAGMAKLVAQVYAFRVAAINTANDSTAVSGVTSMMKQLTGFGGGLIEMRDQLKSAAPDVRGVITPVTSKSLDALGDSFGRVAEKTGFFREGLIRTDRVKKALLKTDNIYLANTREEADAVTKLLADRREDIKNIEMRTEAVTASVNATASERAAVEATNASKAKERASLLGAIGGRTVYIETVNGETRALTANEVARLRGIAASNKVSAAVRQEAAERVKSIVAIDAETTRTASRAGAQTVGIGTRLLGLAGTLGVVLAVGTTLATTFAAIAAQAERMKVNFLEAGGGVASLRDAIKQDTQAYSALTEEQKKSSDQFVTLSVQTETYRNKTSDTVQAIQKMTGVSDDFVNANKEVVTGIKETTLALGEGTRAWFANAIMMDENFQKALAKYPGLLSNLEGMGVSFSGIIADIFADPDADPTEAIKSQISELNAEIDKAQKEATQRAGTNVQLAVSLYERDVKPLVDQRDQLLLTKEAIDSIRTALGTAVQNNEVFNAINEALGVADKTENAILGLQDAFAEASKSGEDMKEIMSQVRTATVKMLEDIDGVDPKIIAEVNDAETVQALINIVQALYETEKAANVAANAMNKWSTGAFWGTAAKTSQALLDGGKAGDLKEILRSLQAIAVAGALKTEDTPEGESASDRLNRLIDESMKAVQAIGAVNNALSSLGEGIKSSTDWNAGSQNINNLASVIGAIGEAAQGDTKRAVRELQILKNIMFQNGLSAKNAKPAFDLINRTIRALGGEANLSKKQLEALRKAFPQVFARFNAELNKAAEKPVFFKTITDWANGLKTVIDESFGNRYGVQIASDQLATAWDNIRKAAADAKDAIADANNEIKGMTADRDIMAYQLSVAERYGDEKRAAKLRADMAKLDKDVAKREADRNRAQEQATGVLAGNSSAAIANRNTLRGIVGEYNNYLIALARSGASSEELQAEVEKLSKDFYAQGKALGFAEAELRDFVLFFTRDFKIAEQLLDPFRKEIQLKFNPDPTVRAVSEFVFGVNEDLGKIIADMEFDITFPKTGTIEEAIAAINAAITANLAKTQYVDIVTRYITEGTPPPANQPPPANNQPPAGGTGGGTGGTGTAPTAGGSTAPKEPQELISRRATWNRLNSSNAVLNAKIASANANITRLQATDFGRSVPGQAQIAGIRRDITNFNEEKRLILRGLDELRDWLNKYNKDNRTTFKYAAGGFVSGKGTGTSDSIPAMLSNGEFVIKASSVKSYGVDFFNALNQQRVSFAPAMGFNQRQQQGPTIVFLSPEDRQLLRQFGDRPVNLYADSTKIAEVANTGNSKMSRRGSR